jgi:hypothetical protein
MDSIEYPGVARQTVHADRLTEIAGLVFAY